MKKILCLMLSAVMFCCMLSGCRVEVEEQNGVGTAGYFQYYLNADETELQKESYIPENEAAQFMIEECMQKIGGTDGAEGKKRLLPEGVSVDAYELGEDGVLAIDFNKKYSEMSRAREILARAGIVKTFTQIPGVRAVYFQVEGSPLTNSKGEVIGEMNADAFVSYPGEDMDAYRNETFTLYFADKSGKRLIKEERKLYYRRNLPKERVVLEQLSAGPMNKGNYPTVPENLGINDITVADQICYIDLDRNFLDYAADISPEISVYSIVNSITDACEVDKVQISIEGDVEGLLLDDMELYKFYEKNEELVLETESHDN